MAMLLSSCISILRSLGLICTAAKALKITSKVPDPASLNTNGIEGNCLGVISAYLDNLLLALVTNTISSLIKSV